MPLPALDILVILPSFALVLFRVSGMVMTAPLYGSPVIPMRIRAALTLALTLVTFPLLRNQLPLAPTIADVLSGAVGELMIGAAIGLALTIMLLAGEVAGTLIGQQAGLVLGEVANPLQEHQASVLGQIYTTVLTLVFLIAGGHRAIIAAVMDTFAIIPVMAMRDTESIVLLLTETLTAAFVTGIRIAGPAMIALFLAAITLAVLSRAMPQLNILTVGFTMKVILALGVAWLALSFCEGLLLQFVADGLDTVRAAFQLPPGRIRISS
jgi:flagellar biosynthetic protein FliR